MRTKLFVTSIIGAHIILIFLHIHKHSLFIKLIYQHQKYEKRKADLLERKHTIQQELYTLQDLTQIKQFALTQLAMEPLQLSQLKQLIP